MTTPAGPTRAQTAANAAAWSVLAIIALTFARAAAGGNAGTWLASKFLNRGAPATDPADWEIRFGSGIVPEPSPTNPGPLPNTTLSDPVPGAQVHPPAACFGAPRSGGWTHAGIDLSAPSGTPIQAPAGGKVTYAAVGTSACGNNIKIDHGGGLSTGYCHVRSFTVAAGDSVLRGQTIGYVGGGKTGQACIGSERCRNGKLTSPDPNGGNSGGPHLHFSVYINAIPQDPAGYIGRNCPRVTAT